MVPASGDPRYAFNSSGVAYNERSATGNTVNVAVPPLVTTCLLSVTPLLAKEAIPEPSVAVSVSGGPGSDTVNVCAFVPETVLPSNASVLLAGLVTARGPFTVTLTGALPIESLAVTVTGPGVAFTAETVTITGDFGWFVLTDTNPVGNAAALILGFPWLSVTVNVLLGPPTQSASDVGEATGAASTGWQTTSSDDADASTAARSRL